MSKMNSNSMLKRRNFIKYTSLTVAGSLILSNKLQAAIKGKMNVLFLMCDDMNTWLLEDKNRYAGKVVAPNIKKLANSGVNFLRTYTAAAVCSPSRTALHSGIAPWRSGHYHNALQVNNSQPLKKAVSMAKLFKQNGYTTAGYGKITHGWDQKEAWDEKVGHKRDPAPPGAPLMKKGRGEQDWGPIHLKEEEMNDSKNADLAITYLKKKHDKPFFLAYGAFNPHMPWYVPKKYFDMFPENELTTPQLKEDDLEDVPALGVALTSGKSKFVKAVKDAGEYMGGIRGYLATTAYTDAQMGRVLDTLDNSPNKDNTIVVLISDHGFHLAEKDHWQKATLWEEGTHCLMMYRAPGVTSPGGVSGRFTSLMDIYPTLAELCSLKPPSYLDGRSLLSLLKNPDAPWESTAISSLCDKGKPTDPYLSIVNDKGRYTRYIDGQEEFYDTTKDPHEWINQIKNPEYAPLIKKFRALLPSDPIKPLQPQPKKKGKKSRK